VPLLLNPGMRKIYIVEDDQAICEILELFFSLENFEVLSFISVKAFNDRNKAIIPDLYLFDVNLPDGSGINLCEHIKMDFHNKCVPVAIMSAHANITHFKELCCPDEMITKPFDLDNLLLRINKIMPSALN
jgi:DNA-binding response OmpR family regulator